MENASPAINITNISGAFWKKSAVFWGSCAIFSFDTLMSVLWFGMILH